MSFNTDIASGGVGSGGGGGGGGGVGSGGGGEVDIRFFGGLDSQPGERHRKLCDTRRRAGL